ncbi:MAG: DUF47 family protein [Bacteroidales bacterium]|jgi:hypothetical protein|nr:DUF47 family protein [Bacteroidales bacterium]MDD4215158.1 DUF47 family protein [Bacteroidales bacterium]
MGINKVFQFFVPKEKKFFPLFEGVAENLEKGAILLNKLVLLIKNDDEKHSIVTQIKQCEEKGDDFTHTIFDELNKTFITPFDREDIQTLTSSLDDVMDYINSCAKRIELYKIHSLPKNTVEISELLVQATRELKIAISELSNLKHPEIIKKSCIRLNEIENLVDDLYYMSVSDLFENEKDAIELIKKDTILKTLETATDMAEDVSDVLKSIIVKVA